MEYFQATYGMTTLIAGIVAYLTVYYGWSSEKKSRLRFSLMLVLPIAGCFSSLLLSWLFVTAGPRVAAFDGGLARLIGAGMMLGVCSLAFFLAAVFSSISIKNIKERALASATAATTSFATYLVCTAPLGVYYWPWIRGFF